MKKLKIILQYNYIYIFLLFLSLIYCFLYINFIKLNSFYSGKEEKIEGYVLDKKINKNKLTLTIKAKEKIIVNYSFDDEKQINNLMYGDYLKIYGSLKEPSENQNFNLFNYKKYLYNKKIFFIMDANKVVKIKSIDKFYFKLKNIIVKRINKCNKTKDYLNAFIIGNKSEIEDLKNYQHLGISHLFAISGMHISILTGLLLKLLNNINSKLKNVILISFLFFYMFLTSFSPSVLRASLLFILLIINKEHNLKIKNINLLIFLFSFLLFINPLYIYDMSFQFTFVISFALIYFSENILRKKGYIKKLIYISSISFLFSLPILINNFYEINIFSIFYNLIYIPYVSFVVFPFGLITFLFPFVDNIYVILIDFLINITTFFNSINSTIIVSKIPIILVALYYIILFNVFNKSSKLKKILLIIILITFYNFNRIKINPEIFIINVNQGDSSLIRIYNKNILIDTGGNYKKEENSFNLCNATLLPFFKSIGVKKIDYLIISHGDFDHMGEAINLVNNFKVESVIFNNDSYNELENELIKVLESKKIKYYKSLKELNIGNDKLHFLNTKEYNNENDNSNVLYFELNDYKFLFMGDAGVDREKYIHDRYNLTDIDFIKIGHHGSNTSSSKYFIDKIRPKNCLISVGKNNRYGHPKEEVLNTLNDYCNIYRTDFNGSIEIKINKNNYKIKTYSP